MQDGNKGNIKRANNAAVNGRFGPDWVSESGVGTLSEIGTTDASQSHKALADLSPITCERLGGAGGGGLVMSWF
ncbi:hypothetical protein J6590_003053 [Homalodisca vitripennis]|nr:hypothetical protein J6590_003053 [Homalodisca vitripennis]